MIHYFKEDPKNNSAQINKSPLKIAELDEETKIPQLDSLGNLIAVVDSTKLLDSLVIESKKPSMVSRALTFWLQVQNIYFWIMK